MRSSSDFLSGIGLTRCIGIVPSGFSSKRRTSPGSDLLIAIPSAPEANDSLPGRNVRGSERDTPLDLPNRVSFVGGDENDRGISSRSSNFLQSVPRHEQRDVAVLATLRRTRKNETS